jgi:RND family efflux transporter MFP subunit
MLMKNTSSQNEVGPFAGSGMAFMRNVVVRGAAQLFLMALVLAASFAITTYLVRTKPEVKARPVFPTVYTVDTIIAQTGTYQPVINLYGDIVAGRSVELRSLVSGEIISVSPKLKSGGTVEAGEFLLEIDPFDFLGALREAEANAAETAAKINEANARLMLEQSGLASARDQLELANSDFSRIADLRKSGAANQKQVDDRKFVLSQRAQVVDQGELNIVAEKARIDQLKANSDRLDWKVQQARRNLANTRLTAPFSGTIRSSAAEIGKLANANDIMVSMYQSDSLEARFILTDERFGRLQADADGIVGRRVAVVWNLGGTDHEFSGRIDRIGAEITSASGGVEIFATLESSANPFAMRPGAFVEIRLPDRSFVDHIALPDSALYNADTVYVVEDGKLVSHSVTIAGFDGDEILVSAGISPGEEVLVTRISEISPGLKVRKEGEAGETPNSPKAVKAPDTTSSEKPETSNGANDG